PPATPPRWTPTTHRTQTAGARTFPRCTTTARTAACAPDRCRSPGSAGTCTGHGRNGCQLALPPVPFAVALQEAPLALPSPAMPMPLRIGTPTLTQLLVAVPPVPDPPVFPPTLGPLLQLLLQLLSQLPHPASAVPPTSVMEPAVASDSSPSAM